LSSNQKGDVLVDLTTKIIPLTELGVLSQFEEIVPRKHSHDDGVDIECRTADKSKIMYVQCKFSLKSADDLDSIFSKFEHFYEKFHPKTEKQQSLFDFFDGSNENKSSNITFMIITFSKIGKILPAYESKAYSSRHFYQQLKNNKQISFLDGPAILSLLQAAFRKLHILPTNVTLHLETAPLKKDNVYIGIVSAKELKDCYDVFGDALFLDNIRSFLGFTSGKKKVDPSRDNVNEKILETARDFPNKMLEKNNGITFRAKHVSKVDDQDLLLDEASIVNGCQTTMCLIQSPKPEACVLVKIVETSDSWDIAKSANFQNKVEQIELELASYIRPQSVKMFGNKAGFYVKHDTYRSVFDVFSSIHQDKVAYDEIYYLFIGLFSRNINNIVNTNYTELRNDLLEAIQVDTNLREETFYTLFELYKTSLIGREQVEDVYSDDSYKNIFQRFWKDNKPNYRSLLTILAACVCVNTNIYDKSVSLRDFLNKLTSSLEGNKNDYISYYMYTFEMVANSLIDLDKDENDILRTMYDNLKRAKFDNLFKKVRLIADREKKRSLRKDKDN
jgi:hypothetical protein